VSVQTPSITPVGRFKQPTSALNLQANETQRRFTVPVSNPGSAALSVLGVQTTSGLYAAQFPTSIPPGGSAVFTLLYNSKPGTSAVSDFLYVLTNQGEISVEISHNRAPAATFSSTTLQWALGETPGPKSVTITMAAGTAVPTGTNAAGLGNSVQLTSNGGGTYTLTVTPNSTALPGSFPVFVQFQPALPDVVAVVTCTVTPN
jgi:hypothetical protein